MFELWEVENKFCRLLYRGTDAKRFEFVIWRSRQAYHAEKREIKGETTIYKLIVDTREKNT